MVLNLKYYCVQKLVVCSKCNCQEKFEIIETGKLNLIQHGRLNQDQIAFLKTRIGNKECKYCFVRRHFK